jgi:hypothetical protein
VVSDKKILKISANQNTLWTLAAILDFKSAPKTQSGRGSSNEHFWQVWLKSVQRFQRRRFKCEKLTDGRTTTHDKSSPGLWPGELKKTTSTDSLPLENSLNQLPNVKQEGSSLCDQVC